MADTQTTDEKRVEALIKRLGTHYPTKVTPEMAAAGYDAACRVLPADLAP